MTMVAFAGFIIVTNEALPAAPAVETIFQAVWALWVKLGQLPDYRLNDRLIPPDFLAVKQ